jgi:hypothetical protein
VTFLIGDALKVSSIGKNRNDYSLGISEWGNTVRRWAVTVIPTHRVEMKLYRFESCPDYKIN